MPRTEIVFSVLESEKKVDRVESYARLALRKNRFRLKPNVKMVLPILDGKRRSEIATVEVT